MKTVKYIKTLQNEFGDIMAQNRGYLKENYRFFHLSDRADMDFESHFHDFHKIIFCLSGEVSYTMEGKTWFLKSKDIFLVPKGRIHKSTISSKDKYERVIIWVKDEYLQGFKDGEKSLSGLFNSQFCNVKADKESFAVIMRILASLEAQENIGLFGAEIIRDAYFAELMVTLCRMTFEKNNAPTSFISDPKFDEILFYINSNLEKELTVDGLAKSFYMSRSYFMHRFKETVGCSVHTYITEKRLFRALELIKGGLPMSSAALESGFSDYTVFYRNFKKAFGVSPAEIK